MLCATTRLLLVSLAVLVASAAPAAAAAPSGPPPTASGGQKVNQVASGLATPTSFAFGDGSVFAGDGGNAKTGPPNGGAFVLRAGRPVKLAGSPPQVTGMAWYRGALYVAGGVIRDWQVLKYSGWNGTRFARHRAVTPRPSALTASTASPSNPTAASTWALTRASPTATTTARRPGLPTPRTSCRSSPTAAA